MSLWQYRRTSRTTATMTTTITTGLILSVCCTLSGAKLSGIIAVGQKARSTATAGPSGTASTRRTTSFNVAGAKGRRSYSSSDSDAAA
ncbi:hypothetical protein BDW02DRAFT_135950 [Decorospora gaudefroyi]|uniref:Uncharacterized protein n=1 Tax=Decorospora gaudefroyi TaxID=184978 RepID=A0A6A5K0X3_9PLEO|nr:hypothetical protein BDW02DRAFT_135950 [Decorospora gaudefroyi]